MSVLFAVEPLQQAQPDIERVLPLQWAETGDPDLVCQPNWAMYYAMEKHGGLYVFTAREAGTHRMVGYMAAFVHSHLNASGYKVATISTYYVEECSMRALLLRSLIKYTVQNMWTRGVVRVFGETEYDHSAGRVWEALGFDPIKVGYRLTLPTETGHA